MHDTLIFPKEPKVSSEAIQFIRELLTRDADNRIGLGEVGFKRLKKHPWLQDSCWDILSSKTVGAPFIPDVCVILFRVNKQFSIYISRNSISFLSLFFFLFIILLHYTV